MMKEMPNDLSYNVLSDDYDEYNILCYASCITVACILKEIQKKCHK